MEGLQASAPRPRTRPGLRTPPPHALGKRFTFALRSHDVRRVDWCVRANGRRWVGAAGFAGGVGRSGERIAKRRLNVGGARDDLLSILQQSEKLCQRPVRETPHEVLAVAKHRFLPLSDTPHPHDLASPRRAFANRG